MASMKMGVSWAALLHICEGAVMGSMKMGVLFEGRFHMGAAVLVCSGKRSRREYEGAIVLWGCR